VKGNFLLSKKKKSGGSKSSWKSSVGQGRLYSLVAPTNLRGAPGKGLRFKGEGQKRGKDWNKEKKQSGKRNPYPK